MAMTGSIGTTRPMKNVTATRPSSVVASTSRNCVTRPRKKRRAMPCPPPSFMAAEAIDASVLLGLRDVLVSNDGPRTKLSTFLRTAATSICCRKITNGLSSRTDFCSSLVHLRPLLGVPFHHGGSGLGGQRSRIPGVAPGQGLGLRGVRVVVVRRERIGVRIRVLVVRAPVADVDVVLAGAVLGQRLLVVAWAGSRA